MEHLQLDIYRISEQPVCDTDIALINTTLSRLSHCLRLRHLRLGFAGLAEDCPSETNRLTLSGASPHLTRLQLPKADQPQYLQPTFRHRRLLHLSKDFDSFRAKLPDLKYLSLKLHPPTASALSATALKGLSTHCSSLSICA